MTGNPVMMPKDGKLFALEENNLHENDLVVVQAGEIVPADLKLVESRGLEIDEFELTGELLPVSKTVEDKDVILYRGSKVTRGSGRGIVIATGEQTEYGKILEQEWEGDKPDEFSLFKPEYLWLVGLLFPALITQLLRTDADVWIIAVYLLGAAIFIILQNNELFQRFLASSEYKKLERSGIKVRAASLLGRIHKIDVICFDKTGVLTTREMAVRKLYFIDRAMDAENGLDGGLGESVFDVVKVACALCNDVQFFEKIGQANLIDKALIAFAVKHGVNLEKMLLEYKRVYDSPFDSEKRHMACGFMRDDQDAIYFAKGDPEVLLNLCSYYVTATGEKKKVDSEFWRNSRLNIDALSESGDTAIALAYRTGILTDSPSAYTFLCLFQLENSLQPNVHETIQNIKDKGIRPIMLTGDRAKTAQNVSEACGIAEGSEACLTGKMIDKMKASEIMKQASYCSVFARLTPSQKAVIIRLLQQKGLSIAMVGDGPNDGIALKAADIGISYIKDGSPVARRLSKILINHLADLSGLIDSSARLEKRTQHLKLFRAMIIVSLLFGIYLWAFVSL